MPPANVPTALTATLEPGLAVTLVIAGILLSLILPIAVATLKKANGLEGTEKYKTLQTWKGRMGDAWVRYGGPKYTAILAAASLVAVVIVFVLDWKFHTYRDAILAGFAWESLLSKLMKSTPNTGG